MSKIRIALMGIDDSIFEVVKKEINPKNAEIVLFFDNDKAKQGIRYMNIPILRPSRQLVEAYLIDYILVAALSAYQNVKKQLIDIGIPKDKIEIFVAEDIQKYCVGSIKAINKELVKHIYFEPQKILDIAAEYENVYRKYSVIPVCEEEPGEWFNKSRLISHACGGMVNGRRSMYSNSREAFQYSVEQKFKLMECDLMRMNDGEALLVHDYGRFYESEQGEYSMLTLEEFLRLMKEQGEISCLMDVKWKDYDEYAFWVDEIDRLIEVITNSNNEAEILKRQVVMEVYDEETIKIAKEKKFNMIFTQYKNARRHHFMDTVILCHKYGVKVIAMAVRDCLAMSKFVHIFTDKNIKIFAFSTDSIKEYSTLRKINVTGVFTNYLTESNVSE